MSLGDVFPSAIVRDQLKPGKIVHLDCEFAGKPKFIVVACIHPGPYGLVINSEVNDFVAKRPHLAQCQVKIDQASHSFLNYDSWIACQEIIVFDLGEIHAQIEADTSRLKCFLSDDVRDQVLSAVKHAVTIPNIQKQAIVRSLSGQN